ncbi:MAG: 5-formyltetrahydrofolate cyclo-ligase [Paracoccus sp. (in: a-proteobacteria)]|uniref:5-formyltetrahydrofolate cyclo-ligase n=1 Tax=Paracoccus sp. TaxID=267 RepID=UPI0026DFB12D|nr:5-formyltetrahydrofolate cyclo-ligase [Paracoccus sp. (in: a-proteobacteria)]MDO5620399.1 5-formyltetrahydrofolate cyclo-ligase [Paracoccus sp. (in: a-proteobacteria)]
MKDQARRAALAARRARGDQIAADRFLSQALVPYAGQALAGFWPMGDEIDPRAAMTVHSGPLCLPVVPGRAVPLIFRRWQPGDALEAGPMGTSHPGEQAPQITPQVLIVPLLAFDAGGNRLGYGGGYYDRTLAQLRAAGPVVAIGFAWACQQQDALPLEPTDQPLDLIVSDAGVILPRRSN